MITNGNVCSTHLHWCLALTATFALQAPTPGSCPFFCDNATETQNSLKSRQETGHGPPFLLHAHHMQEMTIKKPKSPLNFSYMVLSHRTWDWQLKWELPSSTAGSTCEYPKHFRRNSKSCCDSCCPPVHWKHSRRATPERQQHGQAKGRQISCQILGTSRQLC